MITYLTTGKRPGASSFFRRQVPTPAKPYLLWLLPSPAAANVSAIKFFLVASSVTQSIYGPYGPMVTAFLVLVFPCLCSRLRANDIAIIPVPSLLSLS